MKVPYMSMLTDILRFTRQFEEQPTVRLGVAVDCIVYEFLKLNFRSA